MFSRFSWTTKNRCASFAFYANPPSLTLFFRSTETAQAHFGRLQRIMDIPWQWNSPHILKKEKVKNLANFLCSFHWIDHDHRPRHFAAWHFHFGCRHHRSNAAPPSHTISCCQIVLPMSISPVSFHISTILSAKLLAARKIYNHSKCFSSSLRRSPLMFQMPRRPLRPPLPPLSPRCHRRVRPAWVDRCRHPGGTNVPVASTFPVPC